MRTLAAIALVAACGCAHYDPRHPAAGAPSLDEAKPRYWVWWSGGEWHLRATAGGHPHRFQGTISAPVSEMRVNEARLKDHAALVGGAVQFDFDARGGAPGLDFKVPGAGCAKLDLYLDGKRRPDRVRLGARALPAPHLPFERCP